MIMKNVGTLQAGLSSLKARLIETRPIFPRLLYLIETYHQRLRISTVVIHTHHNGCFLLSQFQPHITASVCLHAQTNSPLH